MLHYLYDPRKKHLSPGSKDEASRSDLGDASDFLPWSPISEAKHQSLPYIKYLKKEKAPYLPIQHPDEKALASSHASKTHRSLQSILSNP